MEKIGFFGKRSVKLTRMGENSSFIFTCYVKTVPVYDFNPITYGILTFRQLSFLLFGPDPENKVTVNGLI